MFTTLLATIGIYFGALNIPASVTLYSYGTCYLNTTGGDGMACSPPPTVSAYDPSSWSNVWTTFEADECDNLRKDCGTKQTRFQSATSTARNLPSKSAKVD